MTSDFLQKAARTKAGLSRCVVCGNKWAYCTCGGKTPFDCPRCQAGKGKGPKVGHDRNGRPVFGDNLCQKHMTIGVPVRNRAERRQAQREAKRRAGK